MNTNTEEPAQDMSSRPTVGKKSRYRIIKRDRNGVFEYVIQYKLFNLFWITGAVSPEKDSAFGYLDYFKRKHKPQPDLLIHEE